MSLPVGTDKAATGLYAVERQANAALLEQPASSSKPGVLGFLRGLSRPAPARAPDPAQVAQITGRSDLPLPSGPVPKTTDQRRAEQLDTVLSALATQAEARKLGVDLAKADYFNKAHNVAVAFTNFVLTALLTAATGGLAAPMLALTSLRLVIATADMACARKTLKDAEQEHTTGRPVKDRLPMGSSAVGNLTFWLARSLDKSMDDDRARVWGTRLGSFVSVGLSLSMLFTGLYAAPAFAFTEGLCKMASSTAAGFLGFYEYGKVGLFQAPAQAKLLDKARANMATASATLAHISDEDRAHLAKWLREIKGFAAVNELDSLLQLSDHPENFRREDASQADRRAQAENEANGIRLGTRAYFLVMGAKSAYEGCLKIAALAR